MATFELFEKDYQRKKDAAVALSGAATFLTDEAALKWVEGMEKPFDGAFASMSKTEIKKEIQKAKPSELEGRAKSIRYISDAIKAFDDLMLGKAANNAYFQNLVAHGVVKSMGELATHPENILVIQQNNRFVANTPYDMQWMRFFNTYTANGFNKAQIIDLFADCKFSEIGKDMPIPYVMLADDLVKEISTSRYGHGYKFENHYFRQSPAMYANMAINALQVGNNAKKSEVAYDAVEAGATGTHTLSGTGSTLEQQIEAINAACVTLMGRFQSSDRKSMVATPDMMFTCIYNETFRPTVEAIRRGLPEALATTAQTLAYNIDFISTWEVGTQPNSGTNSLLVGIPFGKNIHTVFSDISFNQENIFDNDITKIGGQSYWDIQVADGDQWTTADLA